jgi:hypothetical protein
VLGVSGNRPAPQIYPAGEVAMGFMCLFLAAFMGGGPSKDLSLHPSKGGTSLEVKATLPAGLADKLPAGKVSPEMGEVLLHMHLVNGGKEGPALLATYQRQGQQLILVPAYPLQPDYLYRIRFTPPGGPEATAEYKVPPRPDGPPASIVKVLPTDEVLPANHLRFYIYFSQPMRGGSEIFNQIRLLDADGKEIPDPWLCDELWNDDGTMLILYIHPGRIKWEVLLRWVLGPVLHPDRRYTLEISSEMLDANDRKLGKDYRKKISTIAEDRVRIELSAWKVKPPQAAGKGPLVIDFPKAMDHLGLARFLRVTDAKGQPVAGTVQVGTGERSWVFHPTQPWSNQEYTVTVDDRLEDVAGNRPTRPFDVDLEAPQPPPQRLTLTFRPK